MSTDSATDLTGTAWIAVATKGGIDNLRVYFRPPAQGMRPCTLQFLANGQVTDTQHGAWAPGPNGAFGFAAGAVAMVGTHAATTATANGFAISVAGEWKLTLDPNPPKP